MQLTFISIKCNDLLFFLLIDFVYTSHLIDSIAVDWLSAFVANDDIL